MSIANGRIEKTAPVWQVGGKNDGFSVEKIKKDMIITSGAVGPETIDTGEVVASAPVMETKVIFFEQNGEGTDEDFFLSANKLKEIVDNITTAASDITSIQATLNVDDATLNTFQELSDRLKTIVEAPDSGTVILQNIQDNANGLDTERSQTTIDIAAESSRAQAAEGVNTTAIAAEATTARAAEQQNAAAIATEATAARAAESGLSTDISDETSRALAVESGLSTDISDEAARALAAESTLNTRITSVDSSLNSSLTLRIDSEASRAFAAEQVNATDISDETTRALAAELVNTDAINSETARATAAEQVNTDAIEQLQLNSGGAVLYSNDETGRIPSLSELDSSSPVKILSKISAEWFFIAITNLTSADIILAHVTDKSKNDIKNYPWTWSNFDALQSHVYHGTPTTEEGETEGGA